MLCFASACPACGQSLLVDVVNLTISECGFLPSQLSSAPSSSCSADPFGLEPMLKVPPYLPNLPSPLTQDFTHAAPQCLPLHPGNPAVEPVAAAAVEPVAAEPVAAASGKAIPLSREQYIALKTAAHGPCPPYPPPARSGTTLLLSRVPFEATSVDIQVFLGEHNASLANTLPWSRNLQCIRQKPGCAIVQFATPEAAHDCCRELDNKMLWDRCIRVVPHSYIAENQAVQRAENQAKSLSRCCQSKEYMERVLQEKEECVERVLQECRTYLNNMEGHIALMSSVGIALSGDGRTILRENGLSLKRILGSFPNEFEVSRISQGRDLVHWYGARSAVDMSSSHRGHMNKVVRHILKKFDETSIFERVHAGEQEPGKHTEVPTVADGNSANASAMCHHVHRNQSTL